MALNIYQKKWVRWQTRIFDLFGPSRRMSRQCQPRSNGSLLHVSSTCGHLEIDIDRSGYGVTSTLATVRPFWQTYDFTAFEGGFVSEDAGAGDVRAFHGVGVGVFTRFEHFDEMVG